MIAGLDGWRSVERRHADGSIETAQRVRVACPVVDVSTAGGRLLGSRYWRELARASRGLVRPSEGRRGLSLRFLGRGPSLLTLGPTEIVVDEDRVTCIYPIRGGLLARREGGALSLSQRGGDRPELCATVSGFFPRLGMLDRHLQRRVHVAISRRYFTRLLEEAQR
jgi:hypothetical protein